MNEEDFNFYRLWKIENNATLPALINLFETLWEKEFPNLPWKQNAESVELFEKKEEEKFENISSENKKDIKNRKINIRKQKLRIIRDKNWSTYNWDVSKVVHALIDSKLFHLAMTDENGLEISGHIMQIKDIRNESAHPTPTQYTSDYFEKTVGQLETHIKSLTLAGVDVSQYIDTLNKVQLMKAPVDGHEVQLLKQECENLKILQKIDEEKQKRYILMEQTLVDNKRFLEIIEDISSEKKTFQQRLNDVNKSEERTLLSEHRSRLENHFAEWNKKHSLVYSKLQSDYEHLQNVSEELSKSHTEKLERIQDENNFLRQLISSTNTMYSKEMQTLRTEVASLKHDFSNTDFDDVEKTK